MNQEWRSRVQFQHWLRKCLSAQEAKRKFWITKRHYGTGFAAWREFALLSRKQSAMENVNGCP